MKILPTSGRLVVKKLESEEVKTETGIFLTGREEVESEEILRVIVEEGSKTFPQGITIYVSKYSAMPIRQNKTGDEIMIVPESDVMAVEVEG